MAHIVSLILLLRLNWPIDVQQEADPELVLKQAIQHPQYVKCCIGQILWLTVLILQEEHQDGVSQTNHVGNTKEAPPDPDQLHLSPPLNVDLHHPNIIPRFYQLLCDCFLYL